MAIKSQQLGPGSLKFGETASEREFATQLRAATLTPAFTDGETLPVLSGDEITEDDETTWDIGGTILQDYSADSLEAWCFANAGQWVPFVFTPNNDQAASWTGEAKIRPVVIGGEVKTRNTSDFTFPARNIAPDAGMTGFSMKQPMQTTAEAPVEKPATKPKA